jgi:hypothetical protein
MQTLPKAGLLTLLPFALLGLTSDSATAQQPEQELAACNATATPQQVQAGEVAAQVSVSLSQPVGQVDQFEAQGDAGLKLAEASDLPRTEMAAEPEQPQPITMAGANQVTLWLNTEEAQPGSYEFTLRGSEGDCRGTITVGG